MFGEELEDDLLAKRSCTGEPLLISISDEAHQLQVAAQQPQHYEELVGLLYSEPGLLGPTLHSCSE